MVESDGVSTSLGGYESPDHCGLRQNLQSKSNRNRGSERKDVKSSSRKENFGQKFPEGVSNDCIFLKEWQKKTEAADSHDPLFKCLEVWHKL